MKCLDHGQDQFQIQYDAAQESPLGDQTTDNPLLWEIQTRDQIGGQHELGGGEMVWRSSSCGDESVLKLVLRGPVIVSGDPHLYYHVARRGTG